jgi:hypothetical protein
LGGVNIFLLGTIYPMGLSCIEDLSSSKAMRNKVSMNGVFMPLSMAKSEQCPIIVHGSFEEFYKN